MDFPLQSIIFCYIIFIRECRNPYFSGLSLAILTKDAQWKVGGKSRNPYFSGLSLAIYLSNYERKLLNKVAILILVDFPLQYGEDWQKE